MTIINPNSISGISSITALNSTAAINLFKADGTSANIIAGVVTATKFVGELSVGSSITFEDNEKAYFGNDGDMQLYHNGSNSFIVNKTGYLQINATETEVGLYVNPNAAVRLAYNGDMKFETTASGARVFNGASGGGILEVYSGDGGSAAGPELKLIRNSGSPADADYIGQIKFVGESDTSVERNYAKITGKILDASNGTEDGILEFAHIKAGSQTITGRWRSDSLQLLNGTALTVAGSTTVTGNIIPSSDSATDIGTNSVRFANIYADTLYGDGSNLTGITQTTINNNAANRIITGSGSANTLNGNTYATWNGNNLALRGGEGENCTIELASDEGDDNADFWRMMAQASDNALAIDHYGSGSWVEKLRIDSNGHISQGGGATPSSTNGNVGLKFGIKSALNNVIIGETTNGSMKGIILESRITGRSGGARCSQVIMGDGVITFETAPSGGAVAERLRIRSDGKVTLGTTTPSSNSAAYMFTVADPTNSLGNCGITIRAGTGGGSNTNQGSIFYSNATSGTGEYAGYLQYNHNDNWFRICLLYTSPSPRD